MRRLERIKESMISLCVVLICLLGIFIVTIVTPRLEAKYESKDEQLGQEMVEILLEEEPELAVDVEALFRYKGISVNDEEQLKKLISILPEGDQVEQLIMPNEIGEFGIQIQYKYIQNNTGINKGNAAQMMLLNSTILMSLCNDLNGVTTKAYIGKDLVEQFVYKGDLDSYFEEDIRASWLLEDFKKYSECFLEKEAAAQYISQKYSYRTDLGEEVDQFFKLNFPIGQLAEGNKMPYMDEDLGKELVKDYGYQLFVEGLKYNNDYMNYYSAYRLLEFYNTSELEEILVELAISKNWTSNEAVKLACTYVMGMLGNQSIQEPIWVTRFRENTFSGGRKVYMIKEGKIKEWGEWELPTAIKEISISPDGEMVWYYGGTLEQEYAYVLPIENERCYSLGKTEIKIEDGETIPELISWAKHQLREKSLMTVTELNSHIQVKVDWFKEAFLKVQLVSNTTEKAQDLFYNAENQMLTPVTIEGEDFSLTQLVYELNDTLSLKGYTHIVQGELEVEGIRLYLGEDYITVYEYSSMQEREKNKQTLQKLILGNNTNKKIYFFEKGRLIVVYEGEETNIIENLTEELNAQVNLT